MEYKHIPVMLAEALEYLNPKSGNIIVDCTLGGGGYTLEIAKRVGKAGKVIAIDADEMAIENAELKVKSEKLENIILVNENFKNLQKIIDHVGVEKVDGIVFDLGLSSAQLEDRSRGFSFNLDAPLDMKFGIKNYELRITTTEEIINKFKQKELEKIIREYGEERYAGRIANAIVKNRPVRTTKELADTIMNAVPASYRRGRIHPATRTFQALRIATNDELSALQEALAQTVKILEDKGRLVIISYHSLEDRIVKNFFKQEARRCICPPEVLQCVCGHQPQLKILTKKVITATDAEIKNNPRARSAKLRAAEKILF
ncbi:MAG: 16S rRNA (cytosine(1402)-N(4))-methyltransferase RsmH [Patescibacteria group bacterium]